MRTCAEAKGGGSEHEIAENSGLEDRGDECAHEVFYKFIIDSLPLAVVTMDSEFRITGFNPWAEALTGYSVEDAMGRNCRDILHSTLCDQECPLRAIQNPETHSVTSRAEISRRDGSTTPVRINTAALFDGSGRRIGGVEALLDLSEIVALERRRTNFISMLAHDIRSSLTGIHGLGLRLLRKPAGMDEEKARQHLEIIAREAGKLESLVDDFLELSRIETGGVKLNLTGVSLDKELMEIFEAYKERAEQRGLRLELQIAEILPVIEADAGRLRRVFTNLLDNAIKFSKDNGVIVIHAHEMDQEVVVSIEDGGVGIDPSEMPFIFDIFHRGRTAAGREGHGLGLATVKAIVEGHGGRIMVASELGAGSTFTMFLPKYSAPPGAEDRHMRDFSRQGTGC